MKLTFFMDTCKWSEQKKKAMVINPRFLLGLQCSFKRLEYNSSCGFLRHFEILPSYMSQWVFLLTLSEDGLSHTQKPWQSYDKPHQDPSIQCSFPHRIKPLGDPNILTGFSCPGGRGDTIPVTRTTDSTGAPDKSFFTWEWACRKMTTSHRNPKSRTNAPCSGASFLKTAHLNPEETALKLICSVRSGLSECLSLLVSQSSQSDKGLCSAPHVCWTQATEGTIKITDSDFGSTYLILWNDDLGQSLEIP